MINLNEELTKISNRYNITYERALEIYNGNYDTSNRKEYFATCMIQSLKAKIYLEKEFNISNEEIPGIDGKRGFIFLMPTVSTRRIVIK